MMMFGLNMLKLTVSRNHILTGLTSQEEVGNKIFTAPFSSSQNYRLCCVVDMNIPQDRAAADITTARLMSFHGVALS